MNSRDLEFRANALPYDGVAGDEEGPRINWVMLALRYKWQLGIAALCGLILGHLAYLKSGPEYEASVRVLVSKLNPVPSKEERALLDWGDRSEHIQLIKSPLIAEKAVRLGDLSQYPTFNGEPEPEEELLGSLRVKRTAGQDRSYINVLDIAYSSSSAAEARAVVAAVVEAYAEYLEETRSENSSDVIAKTDAATKELRSLLDAKEQEYLQFRRESPLQWKAPVGAQSADATGSTTNVHQEAVLAIEEQRRLNLVKRKELESRMHGIRRAIADGESREGLELSIRRFLAQDGAYGEGQQRQQEVTAFENRLLPLLLEEQKLTRDFGRDHPDVVSIRQSIQTTLNFYRQHGIRLPGDKSPAADGKPVRTAESDFVVVYLESLKQQIAELEFRDTVLLEASDDESAKAKEFAGFQTRDEQFNAELQQLREQWKNVMDKRIQVQLERNSTGYTLKQIAPVRHEWVLKRLMKFWMAGMGVCAALAAGLIVLRELQDTTIRSLEDLKLALHNPILGSVVEFKHPAVDTGAGLHPALRYLSAPSSPEAENYRSVRTALLVAAEQQHARIIQVSSAEPGDGKSTVAANLSIALARSGKRVLLIDADLRRPTIHQLFRLRQEIGLTEVQTGEIAFENAIHQTQIEGLSILTSGALPQNPSEILSMPNLGTMLRDASRHYDFILVDCPPLLAVSDPCVVARFTDGMLLVARVGKNRRASLRHVRDLVYGQQIRVLGVVANSVVESPQDAYQYGSYYQYRSPEADAAATSTEPRPVSAV